MTSDPAVASGNRPDPALMRGVIPYLSLDGHASEAIEFYARAFGAREFGRFPDEENPERLMHVQIEINGGCLMMTDCRAPWETEAPKPQGFNLQRIWLQSKAA